MSQQAPPTPVDDEATRLIAQAAREPQLCLTIRNLPELADGQAASACLGREGSLRIGRDERADWLLADRSGGISREHCLIRFADNAFLLEDKSANGTFVNGSSERLRNPYRLRDGDQLCIGPYLIAVQVSGIPDSTAGAAPAAGADGRAPIEHRMYKPGTPAEPMAAPPPAAAAAVDVGPPAIVQRGGDPAALFADPAPARPAPPAATTPAPPAKCARPAAQPVAPCAGSTPAQPLADDNFTRLAPVAGKAATHSASGAQLARNADLPAPGGAPAPGVTSTAARTPGEAAAGERVLAAIARGLGLSIDDIHERDPAVLGERLGELLLLLTGEIRQLVAQRAAAIDELPIGHSLIGGSNPLAIMPTSEEALRVLFGPPRRAYLQPREAFATSLHELSQHLRQTGAAVCTATRLLAGELAPAAIEQAAQGDKGFGQLLGARKGRCWEIYCERWGQRLPLQPERPLASFLRTFAEPATDGADDRDNAGRRDDRADH